MRKVSHWIGNLSIRWKIIFYGYITIAPVLILISVGILLREYNQVQEEQQETDSNTVRTLAENLSVMQTEIKDFTTYICINKQIQLLLTADDVEEKNRNVRLWEQEAPIQIVQDMIALKGYIKTFAIYPENGIRPYLRGMDGSVHLASLEAVRQQGIYQETVASENGYIWRAIPKGSDLLYETNREDKIVICREITDLTRKNQLGFLVIGMSQDYFQNTIQNILNNPGEGVLIFSADGKELARDGVIPEKIESYLKTEGLQDILKEHHTGGVFFQNYQIICQQMEENASIVCKIIPDSAIHAQLKDILYIPILLLLTTLVGLLPLLWIISNLVTKPMRQMSEAIRKFSAGDFEQKVPISTKDEIGEMADCFNHMVEDIKHLIDENYVITLQEKESELALLQAQINPHFLYNALDSLYWQALEHDNEELGENILALSQLFRLVLNQGKREITVEKELELISGYLQIQKMRFGERLHCEVEMQEETRDAVIPKLIVQPFVENAIVHGFEKAEGVCAVSVKVTRETDMLRFEIRDTGVGMSREQIEELWNQDTKQYARQRVGHYAIQNIRERLELNYPGEYSLEIDSTIGKGTVVILRIPFRMELSR